MEAVKRHADSYVIRQKRNVREATGLFSLRLGKPFGLQHFERLGCSSAIGAKLNSQPIPLRWIRPHISCAGNIDIFANNVIF